MRDSLQNQEEAEDQEGHSDEDLDNVEQSFDYQNFVPHTASNKLNRKQSYDPLKYGKPNRNKNLNESSSNIVGKHDALNENLNTD
jgi:hypothetical protein